jgi:hypothetical protein
MEMYAPEIERACPSASLDRAGTLGRAMKVSAVERIRHNQDSRSLDFSHFSAETYYNI